MTTDNDAYQELTGDELRALAFAAIVGVLTETSPDDSSMPVDANRFLAMAREGLRSGPVDPTRIKDCTRILLEEATRR